MSITIKDLAKMANVSHTTVSRALNDSPLINEKTKQRIRDLAKRYHYTPNINAKSLVTERSYQIGLFFSTIYRGTSAVFFHEAVKGVNSVIDGTYNLVVKGIDELGEIRNLSRKQFDGIILVSQSPEDRSFIEYVLEQGIPLVVLNRNIHRDDVLNIVSDDRQGAFAAVDYLIRQGHRDVALIQGKTGFQSTEERTKGYLQALEQHGISVKKAYIVQGDYDILGGYQAMKRLIQLEHRPTAVFCSNDEMTVGAIRALNEFAVPVPDEMSVVGFDDSSFTAFLTPAITAVQRPIQALSKMGAERLLAAIENKSRLAGTEYMPTELIVRESASKQEENKL